MGQILEYFYRRLNQYYAEGNLETVERFLLGYKQEAKQDDGDVLIAVCNELGSFYRGTSRYRESVSAFQEAKEAIAAQLGTDCLEYATLLNNMAGTFRLAGQQERAISCFSKAVAIYRRQGAEDSYDYASVLNNMALAYQELGANEQAAQNLEQALTLIQNMQGHRHETAVTYSNLTALYHKMGKPQEAMRCLDLALKTFEECSEEENVHYAAALNSLAGFLYGSEDYERAISTYRKAAAYTKRFFGENAEYAVTHQNMSWVYKSMGKTRLAAEVLQVAEKIYCRLFGTDHERTMMVREELKQLQEETAL